MLRLGKKIIKMSGGGMTALSIAAATMIASCAFIAGDEASAVTPGGKQVLNLHFGGKSFGIRRATGISNFGGSHKIVRTRSLIDLTRTAGSSSYDKNPLVLLKSESNPNINKGILYPFSK